MPGHLARLANSDPLHRKVARISRWTLLLILAVALRKWVDSPDWPHLWNSFDFGYRGESRLYLNTELVLCGLALLAPFVYLRACPAWSTLFRPVPRTTLALVSAILLLSALAILLANPEALHSEFRPLNPKDDFRSWAISIAALSLGAFQQEIWGRAILQSTLARITGNHWISLAVTAILLAADQPGHRLGVFSSSVLFGIVFIRTGSVACTTILHMTLSVVMGVLSGGTFMVASFLEPRDAPGVLVLLCVCLLVLAFAVEVRYRRSPRLTQWAMAALKTLLLMSVVYAIYKVTGTLLNPAWKALRNGNEWMTGMLVTRLDLLVQAAVPVAVLAWLGRGPKLRDLLAVRPIATASLALAAAPIPFLAAAVAIPDAFGAGLFAPLSPFTTNPYYWLGAVLPLVVAAFQEELVHRALVQPLLSRLFRSEWAGVVTSALHFTAFHPAESAVFVFPGGLLFAMVFMRTRSIVCTTVLHLMLNVASGLLYSTKFTLTPFIPGHLSVHTGPLTGALILVLAVTFEWCWRYSAEGRARRCASPPNERTPTAAPEPTSA